MDVLRCVRSLIELQSQLQRAIAMQEKIQNDLLAHLLRPEQTRPPPPNGYESSEDIEACFAALEGAACTSNIPPSEWTKRIMNIVGMNMTDGDGLNRAQQDNEYELLKDHLCSQARMAEEQWQVRFTLASFDSVKGARELGQGLDQAARHWLKPARRSAEDVVGLIALHKFVNLLPTAASDWVMRHRPKDMEQAIGLAEQFLETTSKDWCTEMDKEFTREQNTAESSETRYASEIRNSEAVSLTGKEDHTARMVAAKEETTLVFCQSVSFNVNAEAVGEVRVVEKEEEEGEAGNEPEGLATIVKQEPMEEEEDCGTGAVADSPSIQEHTEESSTPPVQHIASLSPLGQSSSVMTSRSPPVKRPSTTVKKVSSMRVNEAVATAMKDHSTCSDCGKSFTTLFLLHRHRNACHPLFVCQICDATFTLKSRLTQHSRIHNKGHRCPHCDKMFRDSHSLRTHLTVHNGERPYRCPDCGDTFRLKDVLMEHRNTHTGDRPFVCPECGKGFSHSRTLSRHRQFHSDLRPHLCTLCGKTFKIKGILRRHQQKVHEK